MSSLSITLLSLLRLISLYEPNLLIPPAADKACRIFEFPVNVYIPGFNALPVTKIFTSLILSKLMNASVPMNAEFTFDLRRE